MIEVTLSQGFVKRWPIEEKIWLSSPNSAVDYALSIVATNNVSYCPMPTLPPLTDTTAWREIIANKSVFGNFRPEEIIAVYDTRNDATDPFVLARIEAHIFDRIQQYLSEKDDKSAGGERSCTARLIITKAIGRPASSDGVLLRNRFYAMLKFAWRRANQKENEYGKRHTGLSNWPVIETDSDRSDSEDNITEITGKRLATNPVEDVLIETIDATNSILAEQQSKRRLARIWTIQGCSQESIANTLEISTRQIRRWQREFELGNQAKPEAKRDK